MPRTVIAIYDDLYDAQRAIHTLRETARFSETSINLLARDDEGEELVRRIEGSFEILDDDDVDELGVTRAGAEVGAVIGAIGGLLAGLGVLVIPGIGQVVAAGPLLTTLVGAVGGAATGGVIGAFVEAGIPESDAHAYAEALRRGSTLVTVDATDENHAATAIDILGRFNPIDLEQRTRRWREQGWNGRYEPRHTTPVGVSAHDSGAPPAFTASYHDTTLGSDWYARQENFYRQHFQENRPPEGTFEDFKTAYRFGARFGADQRFARYEWGELRGHLRERWTNLPEREPWEHVHRYVRFAWDRTRRDLWGDITEASLGN